LSSIAIISKLFSSLVYNVLYLARTCPVIFWKPPFTYVRSHIVTSWSFSCAIWWYVDSLTRRSFLIWCWTKCFAGWLPSVIWQVDVWNVVCFVLLFVCKLLFATLLSCIACLWM